MSTQQLLTFLQQSIMLFASEHKEDVFMRTPANNMSRRTTYRPGQLSLADGVRKGSWCSGGLPHLSPSEIWANCGTRDITLAERELQGARRRLFRHSLEGTRARRTHRLSNGRPYRSLSAAFISALLTLVVSLCHWKWSLVWMMARCYGCSVSCTCNDFAFPRGLRVCHLLQ